LNTWKETLPGSSTAKIRSFHDKQKFEHAGAAYGYLDYFGFPFCKGESYMK
jgi:hypothetical protein